MSSFDLRYFLIFLDVIQSVLIAYDAFFYNPLVSQIFCVCVEIHHDDKFKLNYLKKKNLSH